MRESERENEAVSKRAKEKDEERCNAPLRRNFVQTLITIISIRYRADTLKVNSKPIVGILRVDETSEGILATSSSNDTTFRPRPSPHPGTPVQKVYKVYNHKRLMHARRQRGTTRIL